MNEEPQEAKPASLVEQKRHAPHKKRHILRNLLIGFLSILLFLCLLGYGFWRWKYPYGYRCCVTSIMWLDLGRYASEHDGWYPKDGDTPLESLQKLCVDARGCGHLAGFSGSEKKVIARLSSGGKLDETISSWVYFPGLRNDDEDWLAAQGIKPMYGLALAWERRSGIGMSGLRASEGSHLVIFSREHPTQISGTEWDSFVKDQEKCRRIIFATRTQQPVTNALPSKTD